MCKVVKANEESGKLFQIDNQDFQGEDFQPE
jgi:hypothetical protein